MLVKIFLHSTTPCALRFSSYVGFSTEAAIAWVYDFLNTEDLSFALSCLSKYLSIDLYIRSSIRSSAHPVQLKQHLFCTQQPFGLVLGARERGGMEYFLSWRF